MQDQQLVSLENGFMIRSPNSYLQLTCTKAPYQDLDKHLPEMKGGIFWQQQQHARLWPPRWVDAEAYNADPKNSMNKIPPAIMVRNPDPLSQRPSAYLTRYTRSMIFETMKRGAHLVDLGKTVGISSESQWPIRFMNNSIDFAHSPRGGLGLGVWNDSSVKNWVQPFQENVPPRDFVVFQTPSPESKRKGSDQYLYLGVVSVPGWGQDVGHRFSWGYVPDQTGNIDPKYYGDLEMQWPGLDNADLERLQWKHIVNMIRRGNVNMNEVIRKLEENDIPQQRQYHEQQRQQHQQKQQQEEEDQQNPGGESSQGASKANPENHNPFANLDWDAISRAIEAAHKIQDREGIDWDAVARQIEDANTTQNQGAVDWEEVARSLGEQASAAETQDDNEVCPAGE
ncbi:hypothetical protein SUNI508_01596 [Seiridium unicorne]|uniref:Uncharacterized protein n=1 Tax=Seiridium unicorne TaxID=138068 RepID=A0ABR2UU20_9PEZI